MVESKMASGYVDIRILRETEEYIIFVYNRVVTFPALDCYLLFHSIFVRFCFERCIQGPAIYQWLSFLQI